MRSSLVTFLPAFLLSSLGFQASAANPLTQAYFASNEAGTGLPELSHVKVNIQAYEHFSHPSFSGYNLRIKEPKLCDPSVLQYSGYLDIAEDKHIFFWFFESRSSPEKDPLVLWLSGGPGCSSSAGLLFELGPCTIENEGNSTTHNPYSWNSKANIIFLDQPINVGYSYSDNGSTVKNTPVAATDVYAFLELFIQRFSKYESLPFHIAAESYGGNYAPHIASVIHKKNKELIYAPHSGLKKINLESILIGNGLTDPLIQMPSVVEYACDGPFAVFDDPNGRECTSLRRRAPICERLIKACYKYDTQTTCAPATLYCWTAVFGPLYATGRNIYDVRRECDPEKMGPLCYREIPWIETYMNRPDVQKVLGAAQKRPFQACNVPMNRAFMFQGDGMRNSKALLTDLINNGIRLLVYAGNFDMMCNYMGEEQWVSQFDSQFHEEFSASQATPWTTLKSGVLAGVVRSAGGDGLTAGNVTFLTVYDAGHMVPHDQPEAALDMLNRWISNVPFTDNTKRK